MQFAGVAVCNIRTLIVNIFIFAFNTFHLSPSETVRYIHLPLSFPFTY